MTDAPDSTSPQPAEPAEPAPAAAAEVTYKVADHPWSPDDPVRSEQDLNTQGQAGWQLASVHPDRHRERTRWVFSQGPAPVSYKVVDQPWSPSDPSVAEAMLNQVGQGGWVLNTAYPDPQRERTRWIFGLGSAPAGGAGIPEAPADGGLYGRQNTAWSLIPAQPAGSSAVPLMNGTATPGSAAAWSRGDHVHPIDLSRAPVLTPAFTGGLVTFNGVDGTNNIVTFYSYGTGAANNVIRGNRARNTSAAPLPAQATDILLVLNGAGYDTSLFTPSTTIRFAAAETFTPTAHGSYFSFLTTPLGSIAPAESVRFQPSGGVSIGAAAIAGDPGAGSLNLSGTLTLAADPAAALQAATKQYVDSTTVPLSGGTMTGVLSLKGTTAADNAAAGMVGEVLSSIQATAQPLTTATPKLVTSLSLTPGDWDVQGEVWIAAGTAGPTATAGAINTSVSIPGAVALGVSSRQISAAIAANSTLVMPLTPCRVNIAAATVYNLVAQAAFPSGATSATGKMWARRAR